MKSQRTFTGGIRIRNAQTGLTSNVSWPLANLIIGDDELTLSCSFGCYRFTAIDLSKISKYEKGFLSKGFRFYHEVASYPDLLVFWCFRYQKIASALRDANFEIEF